MNYSPLILFLGVLFILEVSGQERSLSGGQRKFRRNQLPAGKSRIVDFNCPEEFGYYAHPSDCSQYYVCVFGGALLESCTGGLMYSNRLQTCDWPRNAGCELSLPGGGINTVAITDPRTSQRPTSPVNAATEAFPSSASIRRGIDNAIPTSIDDRKSRNLRQGRFLPDQQGLEGQTINTGFQAQETSSRTFNVVPSGASKTRGFSSSIPSSSQRFSAATTADKADDYYYIYDDIIYDDYFDPVVEQAKPTPSRTPSRASSRSQTTSRIQANTAQAQSTSRRNPSSKSIVSTSFSSNRPLPSTSSSSRASSVSSTSRGPVRANTRTRGALKTSKKAPSRPTNIEPAANRKDNSTDSNNVSGPQRRFKFPAKSTQLLQSPASTKLLPLSITPSDSSLSSPIASHDNVSHSSSPSDHDPNTKSIPPTSNKGPKLRVSLSPLRSSPTLVGNGDDRDRSTKEDNLNTKGNKKQFPISTITVALLKNSQRGHREGSSIPKAISAFSPRLPTLIPFTRRRFSPPNHKNKSKNTVLKPEVVKLKSDERKAVDSSITLPTVVPNRPKSKHQNLTSDNEITSKESSPPEKGSSAVTTFKPEIPFMVIPSSLRMSDLRSRLPASTSPIFRSPFPIIKEKAGPKNAKGRKVNQATTQQITTPRAKTSVVTTVKPSVKTTSRATLKPSTPIPTTLPPRTTAAQIVTTEKPSKPQITSKIAPVKRRKPSFNIGINRSKLSPNTKTQDRNVRPSVRNPVKDIDNPTRKSSPSDRNFSKVRSHLRTSRPRFPLNTKDSLDAELLNNTAVPSSSKSSKSRILKLDAPLRSTKTKTNHSQFSSTPTLPQTSSRSLSRSRGPIVRPPLLRSSLPRKPVSNKSQKSKPHVKVQKQEKPSTSRKSSKLSGSFSNHRISSLSSKIPPPLSHSKNNQRPTTISTTGKSISSGITRDQFEITDTIEGTKSNKKHFSTITVPHLRNTKQKDSTSHSNTTNKTSTSPNTTPSKAANQQPSLRLPSLNKSIDRPAVSKTSSIPSPETGEESSSSKSKTKTSQGGSPSLFGSAPTRSRIKLPSLANMPKPKPKKQVTDIWKYPPRRPAPTRPQPPVGSVATRCDRKVCQIPDCYCGGGPIPGNLKAETIPQLVLLTFDDAVNDLNKQLFKDLFEEGRVNPNGCPIAATFYVSHEWTDYTQVQNLYADGHEIASHSITHSFGEQFSVKKWAQEIHGQREILSAYGGVRMEDVRGMRAPFLAIGGNKMFEMLYDLNFTYDSSMPVYNNNPPSWPYTLDYKLFHDCMIPPCPTKSFPGVWEVPMVMWQDLVGGRCSMADACTTPADANGVYDMLIKNFERHYTTNRSPFGLYYHAAWFTKKHHKEGFIAFLDAITALNDVWIITNHQALQWVRNPVPLSQVNSFKPFQCDYPERPSRCSSPRVCNVWHKGSARYMKTCQACPQAYPWTGKTGVPSPLNQV